MSFKLSVQISANAGRNEIVGWKGDRLKIKVRAPAVDGKANEELLRFLAERLEIHRAEITIVRGTTSKTKVLSIERLDEEMFCKRLGLAPKDQDTPRT